MKAYYAGGCFWCITPSIEACEGVLSVTAGYSGGSEASPRYEDVKAQRTHHRESIEVEYDPEKTSYRELTELFLNSIDPYDDGGQFLDRGESYTTAIYTNGPEEESTAKELIARLEDGSGKKCAVKVEPFGAFWTAEAYHQEYYRTHPDEFAREMEESGRNAYFEKRDREA